VPRAKSEQLQIRVTREQKAALRRLAGRAGQDVSSYVLARALPAAALRFDALLRALARESEPGYALAELSDLLASLASGELADATADADLGDLSPYLQNYVAAMVERAAELRGVAPPAWTGGVPVLEEPHFAAPLPGLRLHLLRASPVAFRCRNLFVDASVGERV
jgi:hypothetical protein